MKGHKGVSRGSEIRCIPFCGETLLRSSNIGQPHYVYLGMYWKLNKIFLGLPFSFPLCFEYGDSSLPCRLKIVIL